MSQKKIFYALRPAAALRWLRVHPDANVAPMHVPTLIAQCEPPAEVADLATELIALKAVTRELGAGPLPPIIAAFIDREFEIARSEFDGGFVATSEAARREAETFFREATLRC